MLAAAVGSPWLIAAQSCYIGMRNGDIVVLEARKEKSYLGNEHGKIGLHAACRARTFHRQPESAFRAGQK